MKTVVHHPCCGSKGNRHLKTCRNNGKWSAANAERADRRTELRAGAARKPWKDRKLPTVETDLEEDEARFEDQAGPPMPTSREEERKGKYKIGWFCYGGCRGQFLSCVHQPDNTAACPLCGSTKIAPHRVYER